MALNRLTVFLLKDVEEFSDALADEKDPDRVELDQESGLEGEFWWSARAPSAPPWVEFIGEVLSETPDGLRSSSASGLLIVRVATSVFALTFGYGRSFLRPETIVRGFGLKVALNRIDSQQMRSIDTKAYEDLVVAKTTQASKSTEVRTFGIEPMRDILRAVTGEPRTQELGNRLSGADALVLNIAVEPGDLPALLEKALEAYHDDEYKKDFEWVDHLALVTDPTIIEVLDGKLVAALKVKDTSVTHLAIPDAIEWEDIHAFKIRGARNNEYDDLDLDDYLEDLKTTDDLTIELLKSRGVLISFARSSEDWDQKWTLYHCLVSEQRYKGGLFALIEGRWFSISKRLVDDVDAAVGHIGVSGLPLPAAMTGEKEGEYNERVSASMGFVSLDTKLVRPAGATSGIEFCDMLAPNRTFVHVKRKSRSSTLSHLFAQGLVSINAMIGDGVFREKVRGIIGEQSKGFESSIIDDWVSAVPGSAEAISGSDYSVAYVVIAKSTKPGNDWLPFFSKLNLMQTVRSLAPLGVKVSLDRVDVK